MTTAENGCVIVSCTFKATPLAAKVSACPINALLAYNGRDVLSKSTILEQHTENEIIEAVNGMFDWADRNQLAITGSLAYVRPFNEITETCIIREDGSSGAAEMKIIIKDSMAEKRKTVSEAEKLAAIKAFYLQNHRLPTNSGDRYVHDDTDLPVGKYYATIMKNYNLWRECEDYAAK